MTLIHPTAVIDPKAELGSEVEVGAYSVIGPNVRIGDHSKIGPHAVLQGHTTLGRENQIHPFASVGGTPQDLKYKGEPTTLVMGDRNVVRECATIHIGTVTGRGTTTVGSGNLFMANSHVAHDCVVGDNNVLANSVALAGHVTVGNRVILGGMAGIHQFARVGDFSLIGAGAMVSKDVPPFMLCQGDRAYLFGVNVIGLRRAGFSEEDISAAKKSYRKLFFGGAYSKQKLAELPPEICDRPLVQMLLEFLKSEDGERGITPGSKRSHD